MWNARRHERFPDPDVMVGLPAAGTTTRARQIEATPPALRPSLDAWMLPLFEEPDARGKQDVLEGRLVWLAMRTLRLGVCVILDLGLEQVVATVVSQRVRD